MAIILKREPLREIETPVTYCAVGILRTLRASDLPASFGHNPLADCGFFGFRTAPLQPGNGNMNHRYSGKIGIRFPEAKGVVHNDHLAEQRKLNRISKRDQKRLERGQRNRIWKKAARLAFRLLGKEASGPFQGIMIAACAAHVILDELLDYRNMAEHMIRADRDTGYMGGGYEKSESIRKVSDARGKALRGMYRGAVVPTVEDGRESCDEYIRKGTHGASKDAPRVPLYSRDGFL